MVNPEAVQEWKANPVTMAMMEAIEEYKQNLLYAMAQGHYYNPESMEETFGNTAKFCGEVQGIETLKRIITEEENE